MIVPYHILNQPLTHPVGTNKLSSEDTAESRSLHHNDDYVMEVPLIVQFKSNVKWPLPVTFSFCLVYFLLLDLSIQDKKHNDKKPQVL